MRGGWWMKRRSESGADWLDRLGTGEVETQIGGWSWSALLIVSPDVPVLEDRPLCGMLMSETGLL